MDRRKKVLIVEDESITAMSIEAYVEDLGHEVVGMPATGEEALCLFRAERPDLVLMDFRLGGRLDGVETAKLICAEGAVRIAMISGYAERVVLEGVAGFKPAAFLSKPINFSDLDRILASIE